MAWAIAYICFSDGASRQDRFPANPVLATCCTGAQEGAGNPDVNNFRHFGEFLVNLHVLEYNIFI